MDLERAIAKVSAIVALLDASRAIYLGTEDHWKDPNWEPTNRSILQQLPLIRQIAAAAHPDATGRITEVQNSYTWTWDQCRDACLELLGALNSAEEAAEILGPSGPKLSATQLHPWVWHAAVDLWSMKQYRHAVLDAYTKVEKLTQGKIDVHDLSGKKLWGEAFSLQNPKAGRARLRFADVQPGSERYFATHEGALHFGTACAQGIRNWAAHETESGDEQLALEYLASLSVLARWVDQCVVATPDDN